MSACLVVHIHDACTQTGSAFNVVFRTHGHEMHVERLLTLFGHSFQHRKTKRNVRHKHTVHNVHVEPVGIATVYHCYVATQMKKVGRQQRGRYFYTHGLAFLVQTNGFDTTTFIHTKRAGKTADKL